MTVRRDEVVVDDGAFGVHVAVPDVAQRRGDRAHPGDLRRRRVHHRRGRPLGRAGLHGRGARPVLAVRARARRRPRRRGADPVDGSWWPARWRAGGRRLPGHHGAPPRAARGHRPRRACSASASAAPSRSGCALAGDPDAVVSYYGSGVPDMVDQLGSITAPHAPPLRWRRSLHPCRGAGGGDRGRAQAPGHRAERGGGGGACLRQPRGADVPRRRRGGTGAGRSPERSWLATSRRPARRSRQPRFRRPRRAAKHSDIESVPTASDGHERLEQALAPPSRR